MRAVETVLQLNGIAITPMGNRFLKVTVAAQAKSEAPELIEGSTLGMPPSGRIASKLFRLQFLQIADLIPQLGSILNTANAAAPVLFDKANSALFTDSISNLQRVETLVNQLDQPALAGMEPRFYPLHFAKASDVVGKVRNSFTGVLQNKLGAGTTLNADDRTNQVIVVTDARQYPFFRCLDREIGPAVRAQHEKRGHTAEIRLRQRRGHDSHPDGHGPECGHSIQRWRCGEGRSKNAGPFPRHRCCKRPACALD